MLRREPALLDPRRGAERGRRATPSRRSRRPRSDASRPRRGRFRSRSPGAGRGGSRHGSRSSSVPACVAIGSASSSRTTRGSFSRARPTPCAVPTSRSCHGRGSRRSEAPSPHSRALPISRSRSSPEQYRGGVPHQSRRLPRRRSAARLGDRQRGEDGRRVSDPAVAPHAGSRQCARVRGILPGFTVTVSTIFEI